MATQTIQDIFANLVPDEKKLTRLQGEADAKVNYLIGMTPRSGSSHLCDVLKNGKLMGRPGEMLSREFLPGILPNVPGRTPDEYLTHVLRALRSSNSISGIKASWFQFKEFREAMADPDALLKLRFIYLIRRDVAAQAVSLYRATQTTVFHTNIEHSPEALARLDKLEYDYDMIRLWRNHIVNQEIGWQKFFAEHKIFPLCIHYEDIDDDVVEVAHRIAAFIGRPRAARDCVADASVFKKISSRKNIEWAARFTLEFDAEQRKREAAKAPPVAVLATRPG